MKLRISEAHEELVRRLLASSFRNGRRQAETGCILLVAHNDYPANPALLVGDVLEPGAGDFSRQGPGALSFSSRYLRRALLAVRERKLAGFLTVHTHPFADSEVSFSGYDDENDPGLMANLYDLHPGGVFGSIVAGRQSMAARLWRPGGIQMPIKEMIAVGEQLRTCALNGKAFNVPSVPQALFDRALAVTGAGALARLSRMRVAVIGDSGTGSLMIELLMRAGAGEIVIFEFDIAEKSNLNRVLHMRTSDAEAQRSKADRTAEVVRETGLPTRVTVIEGGDIRESAVADHLRGCDLIIGCVDRDWPRLIMCEAAYQYLIPYIDLGAEIGANETEVQSVDARVSYIAPGRPCLLCAGVVTQERVLTGGSHR